MGKPDVKTMRKPMKKRHSIVYHAGTNRVNKYLSQAIEARSVDQEKSTHVNLITLCFRDSEKEQNYHQEKDRSFVIAAACSLILLCLIGALQAVILPSTVLLVILFISSFSWIALLLIFIFGTRLHWPNADFSKSFKARMIVIFATILCLYITAQVNVVSIISSIYIFGLIYLLSSIGDMFG